MQIRPATIEDSQAISDLILDLAPLFVAPVGAEAFLATLAPAAIAGLIDSPGFRYSVGERDGRIVGVVALREHTHLHHLFVARPWHGQGLARLLWTHARSAALSHAGATRLTVNATDVAFPIYRRWGFEPTGARVEMHGIAFTPMQWLI